ncbi:retrovirus-related pol polyprotein from transposon TNT 1-94 [Tanacetum coccineum]
MMDLPNDFSFNAYSLEDIEENPSWAKGNPQQDLKNKGTIDSGCSRHMTGNRSYLTDYEEIDGGFVAFRGKGNLEDVYLQNNLKSNQPGVLVKRESNTELLVRPKQCDNGTKFKNRVMNQFCKMKGIKREFSVARTPQQNRVAVRKNKALIEAARTMLADSKLPTTLWAEAVNTACYVQNRVLVIKPQNKTPYELFLGRKHALSFMRPFGCPVTILSTIDHQVKFDGKADVGFKEISLCLDFKPSGEEEKKDVEDPGNESGNPTKGKDSETPKVNVVDPKTSIELLNDPNMPELEDIIYSDDAEDVGVEANMNNLDTFMLVWTLMDLPNGKRAIVLMVYKEQEELQRIEAIRLFLAYASLRHYVHSNQMDVQHTDFSYGKIKEEDGIFIKYKQVCDQILKKFGFSDVKTASTPMETQKPLLKDADGEDT